APARAVTPRGDAVIVRGEDADVIRTVGTDEAAPFLVPLTSSRTEWSPDGTHLLSGGMLWDGRGATPIATTRATALVGNGCVAERGSTRRLGRIDPGAWLETAVVAAGPPGLVAFGSDGPVGGGPDALVAVRGGTPVVTTGAYASIARFVAACR